MAALTTEWAIAWVRGSAAVVAEHRAELSGLDREIGDGDHGENLDRGFRQAEYDANKRLIDQGAAPRNQLTALEAALAASKAALAALTELAARALNLTAWLTRPPRAVSMGACVLQNDSKFRSSSTSSRGVLGRCRFPRPDGTSRPNNDKENNENI